MESYKNRTVAVIGLGHMGTHIASRILESYTKNGWDCSLVTLYSSSPEKLVSFLDKYPNVTTVLRGNAEAAKEATIFVCATDLPMLSLLRRSNIEEHQQLVHISATVSNDRIHQIIGRQVEVIHLMTSGITPFGKTLPTLMWASGGKAPDTGEPTKLAELLNCLQVAGSLQIVREEDWLAPTILLYSLPALYADLLKAVMVGAIQTFAREKCNVSMEAIEEWCKASLVSIVNAWAPTDTAVQAKTPKEIKYAIATPGGVTELGLKTMAPMLSKVTDGMQEAFTAMIEEMTELTQIQRTKI